MKKLLLLISILLTFHANAQTSVYHPFPDSNAIWNFHLDAFCTPGTVFENYSVTISGDTSINSLIYHKLTTPFVQYFQSNLCFTEDAGYKGAIRQDILNKKVFIVPPFQNTEQLLYDFNLQVGDTLNGYIRSVSSPHDIVLSIDSVLVGSDYRKRWNFSSFFSIKLIEGIGSTWGLIQRSPGQMLDPPAYSIICYSQNQIALYPSTSTGCQLITDIETTPGNILSTNIFPNPFHSSALLNVNPAFENSELKIYSVLGERIKQQSITNKSTIINREALSNGIYFFQATNVNGQVLTGKFIIE
jgi:hypothetical protein